MIFTYSILNILLTAVGNSVFYFPVRRNLPNIKLIINKNKLLISRPARISIWQYISGSLMFNIFKSSIYVFGQVYGLLFLIIKQPPIFIFKISDVVTRWRNRNKTNSCIVIVNHQLFFSSGDILYIYISIREFFIQWFVG